jgi:hypothetical protein
MARLKCRALSAPIFFVKFKGFGFALKNLDSLWTCISRRGSLGPEVTGEHFKLDARGLTVSIEIIKLSMSCASCNTFVSRPPQSISCFSLDF